MDPSRSSQDETRALAERARAGDRAAFDALVRAHRERLLASIRARARHHGGGGLDPEDVLSETVLRALEAVGGFEWSGEDSFLRWLFGISRNVQLDGVRRARTTIGLEAAAEAASAGPSPSQAARREERFERLAEAIRGLPAAYREVIRLSRIDGQRTRDIAARLGKSEEAVRHLLSRGLRSLRKALEATNSFHLPDRGLPWEEGRDG